MRVRLWTMPAMCVLIALTLVTGVAGCGMAQTSATPTPKPSPTSDPALARYATAVQSYYQPFSDAIDSEGYDCRAVHPTPWASCHSETELVLSTGQTLLAQLPATPPPAQLQTADTELKQAVQATLSAYMQRAPAVAANNGAAFEAGNAGIGQAVSMQCAPIEQIDAVAPSGTHSAPPHGVCPA